jgi:hypothetical protein
VAPQGEWQHKPESELQKKKHPANPKPTPECNPQAGLVPPPRASRFMIFDQLHRQNHADRPEGTRPLKTTIFPAPRHTLARTFAAQLAALVSDKCVSGHRLSLPSFEIEPKLKFDFSRGSLPAILLFKGAKYKNRRDT